MTMVVRQATPADADALAALEAAAFGPRSWGAASVIGGFDAPGAAILVATANDEMLGFAIWRDLAGDAEVLTIGVDPSARRRGVAAKLMAALTAAAAKAGAERLFLEVDAGNAAALALYRSLGFEPVGRRKAYYRDGADAWVMAVAL